MTAVIETELQTIMLHQSTLNQLTKLPEKQGLRKKRTQFCLSQFAVFFSLLLYCPFHVVGLTRDLARKGDLLEEKKKIPSQLDSFRVGKLRIIDHYDYFLDSSVDTIQELRN
jgi:hypothetical protein